MAQARKPIPLSQLKAGSTYEVKFMIVDPVNIGNSLMGWVPCYPGSNDPVMVVFESGFSAKIRPEFTLVKYSTSVKPDKKTYEQLKAWLDGEFKEACWALRDHPEFLKVVTQYQWADMSPAGQRKLFENLFKPCIRQPGIKDGKQYESAYVGVYVDQEKNPTGGPNLVKVGGYTEFQDMKEQPIREISALNGKNCLIVVQANGRPISMEPVQKSETAPGGPYGRFKLKVRLARLKEAPEKKTALDLSGLSSKSSESQAPSAVPAASSVPPPPAAPPAPAKRKLAIPAPKNVKKA